VNTVRLGKLMMVVGAMAMAACGEPTAAPIVRAEPLPATPEQPVAPPAPAMPAASTTPPPAAATCAPALAGGEARRRASADSLTVRRLVLARGVRGREPIDVGTSFPSTGRKVYAFVEVDNRAGAPAEVVVEFQPPNGGPPHGDVTLAVGPAPRWRTWAYTRTAIVPGAWTAIVRTRTGEVLARAPFEVTP
jgi:hypothetical protein